MIRIVKTVGREFFELDVKTFRFPGGEVSIKLDATNLRYLSTKSLHQTIVSRIQSSDDLMALALTVDALRRIDNTPIHLFLPYVPYARQDRVCVRGESHSLKIFAEMINNMEFERVTVLDPHSYVTEALFDNLRVITQKDIVSEWDELTNRLRLLNVVLVSPDAGANKKTADLAGYLLHADFIRADKRRNLETGEILETIVYTDDLTDKTVAIIDDLADGGASFVNLAKVLKTKKANKVILYVTHGIFSKGFTVLFNSGIDEIWYTDSFKGQYHEMHDDRIHRLDAEIFL